MPSNECNLITKIMKGGFTLLVSQRARVQKSTVVRFWRLKEKVTLDGEMISYEL